LLGAAVEGVGCVSTIVMSACWPLQMPPTPKSVLIALADNANDHGECWPSLAKICERTCFGKTAVIQAIQWLEEHNLLVADRANGRHTSYRIIPNPAAPDLFASRTGARAEPVRLPNPSGKRSNRSASRTGPVREADTNHQEPSRTKSKEQPQAALPDPPEWLRPAVWDGFVAMRKRIRYPLTAYAAELVLKELDRLRVDHDPNDVLDQSTRNSWRDVFPLRESKSGGARAGPAGAQQVGKTMQGIMALEGLKRGNRMAAGPDRRGDAEALLPGSGKDSGG
jgi:hypothetical protein